MYTQADMATLDSQLAEGVLVLVPNFRSSRLLQDQLAQWRISLGATSIQPSVRILAIDLWLADLWQQLALHSDDPRLEQTLLAPVQETLLWESVIAASPIGESLLNPAGTADMAQAAWLLLLQWQLPASLIRKADYNKSDQTELSATSVFSDWAWRFRELCKRKGVLGLSAMLPLLLELANSEPAAFTTLLPAKVRLWGFAAPPPLYRSFFGTLQRLGVDIGTLAASKADPALDIRPCNQVADEIQAAAVWAAEVLARDSSARIGIICADLSSQQAALRRSFARTLHDTQDNLVLCTSQEPLSDCSLVHTALQLLQLHEDSCDTLLLCQLLRSPWLQSAGHEAAARALLTQRLRNQGELRTSMAEFRQWCQDASATTFAPVLGMALLQFRSALLRTPARAGLHVWFGVFNTLWSALLDTASLQFRQRKAAQLAWQDLQEQMSQSAILLDQCSLPQALRLLSRLAHKQNQWASIQLAPVMFMSPQASAGLRFTHLWCLQMNELQWPADSQPNPFLPLALQREQGLPDCDPGRALQQAQETLLMLRGNTTRQVVYSYALFEDDRQLNPSRLLPEATVNPQPAQALPATLHPALGKFSLAQCESLAESLFLPLLQQQFASTSKLLESQAACPFQAFAHERLDAEELQPLQYGLSRATTGSLVHKILELFWKKFGSQAELLACPADELSRWIADCVANALRQTARKYPHTMTPRFVALEQERLCALLQLWLQQEQQRGPFRRLDVEQDLRWQHARLQLRLRIDRVDTDENGHCVIIDYKTGKPQKVDWQAERQESPQLLLYQQALEQSRNYAPVSAVLHGWVNVEKPCYIGVSNNDSILPGSAWSADAKSELPDWSALKQHWQHSLQLLADEFLAGYVAVAPLRTSTCQYCHLSSLCRIGERRSAYEEANAMENDGSGSTQ